MSNCCQVYGDGSSPALHQLSPLPDSWTPAVTKTPGLDTPEGEAWSPAGEDRGYLSDGDGQESVSAHHNMGEVDYNFVSS